MRWLSKLFLESMDKDQPFGGVVSLMPLAL